MYTYTYSYGIVIRLIYSRTTDIGEVDNLSDVLLFEENRVAVFDTTSAIQMEE